MLYLAMLASYLIGSISFAIVISRFMRLADPREYGSQNAGATNVLRSGNKKAAALTLLCDLLKGLIVVLIAKYTFGKTNGGEALVAICGILVVVGHIYPVFFKFRGGKGVATAIGVLLGFNLYLALLLVAVWLVTFKLSKISSLSALIATILAPIFAYCLMGNNSYFGATVFITILVLWKHKANIIRLLNKQEQPVVKKDTDS
ncbi:MAG: plsY [Burkholderiales bacterium]|jgi:glycerol-3-phosphate acyltransferase PlsY|nr:plsY [Burkholderiales bacterium]